MKQCSWLPVQHLLVFHSLVLLHKTLKHKTPAFLYQKVTSGTDNHNTRQAAASTAALAAAGVSWHASVPGCELELTRNSWCWSAVNWYNKLPPDLISEPKLHKFKTRLKNWVANNVEI
jgi:hypothetical protein